MDLRIVVGLIVSEKVDIILTNFYEKGYWSWKENVDILFNAHCQKIEIPNDLKVCWEEEIQRT
jgi:hypothetical protein